MTDTWEGWGAKRSPPESIMSLHKDRISLFVLANTSWSATDPDRIDRATMSPTEDVQYIRTPGYIETNLARRFFDNTWY